MSNPFEVFKQKKLSKLKTEEAQVVRQTSSQMTADMRSSQDIYSLGEKQTTNWFTRLFSRAKKSKYIRIFSRGKESYGVKNTFESKKSDKIIALGEVLEKNKTITGANPDFLAVVDKLQEYTRMDTTEEQDVLIAESQMLIDQYIASHSEPGNDLDLELLERVKSFKIMFEISENGSLMAPQERKVVENPKLVFGETWEDASAEKLFTHEPNVNDIQQRFTEDCYMMSSLSSIALMNPQAIRDAVRDNGDGTVTVRFFDEKVEKDCFAGAPLQDATQTLAKILFDVKSGKMDKFLDSFEVSEESLAEKEEKKEEAPETKTDEIELDGFEEEDMGLGEAKEEATKEKSTKSETAARIADIKSMTLANNEEWYEEVAKKLLTAKPELLTKIDALFKEKKDSAASDDEIQKQILTEFLNSVKSGVTGEVKSAVREVRVPSRKNLARYVTVTKEVSKVAKTAVNANAADCLWAQMIEKAYAATYKKGGELSTGEGYEGIKLDNSYVFLNHFFQDAGYVVSKFAPDADPDTMYDNLKAALEAKQIICCGATVEDSKRASQLKNTGIRTGHAYSVIGTLEFEGEKFVAIRDPYGLFSREYEKEAGSEAKAANLQSMKLAKKVASGGASLGQNETGGIFYMEMSDFVSTFTEFTGIKGNVRI